MFGRIYRVYLNNQEEVVEVETYEEFQEINPFYIKKWEYLPCYYQSDSKKDNYVVFETQEQFQAFLGEMALHEEDYFSECDATFQAGDKKTFVYGTNKVIFESQEEEEEFQKHYEISEEDYLLKRKRK